MIPVERKGYVCGGILVVVILVLVAANLLLGSVDIPAGAVWGALTGGTVENEAWSFIVWESRVPLCVTAWCCGAALAASGLMLQTVFNNPLADPSILGISSGASLGVAFGHVGRRRDGVGRHFFFFRFSGSGGRCFRRCRVGHGSDSFSFHADT